MCFQHLLELAELDAAEGDLVAVVLKQDAAGVDLAEVFVVAVFAFRYAPAEIGGAAVVFEDHVSIEPVLNLAALERDDAGVIPVAGRGFDFAAVEAFAGRVEVVERSAGPVAVGVRVTRIVQELVLQAELLGLPAVAALVFGNVVLDAAVGALGQLEVELELEGSVFVGGVNVGAAILLRACGVDGELAVLDGPGRRQAVLSGEGWRRCSVEEQLPALGALGGTTALGISTPRSRPGSGSRSENCVAIMRRARRWIRGHGLRVRRRR